MIIEFVIGSVMGLGVGWRLCQKTYDKRLQVHIGQEAQLRTALKQSSELLKQCATLIQLKEPAPAPGNTNTLLIN